MRPLLIFGMPGGCFLYLGVGLPINGELPDREFPPKDYPGGHKTLGLAEGMHN